MVRHVARFQGAPFPKAWVVDPAHPSAPWNAGKHVEAALRHARADEQSRCLHRAACLVAETRVAVRLSVANARGSSPAAREVAEWLREAWPESECRGMSVAYLAALQCEVRRGKILWRFRRRWRVRMAIMPARSPVTEEQAAEKVRRGSPERSLLGRLLVAKLSRFWVPDLGPEWVREVGPEKVAFS